MRTDSQPFFYFNGHRTVARIGHLGKHTHFFGHSDGLVIQNAPEAGPLHQVINLNLTDPYLGLPALPFTRVPLVYGFLFSNDNYKMSYDLISDNEIAMHPIKVDHIFEDWPYRGYPKSFPHIPFSLKPPTHCTLTKFGDHVWQGVRNSEAQNLICIVPPSSRYGFHLWEEDSHIDHIHVKFFIDIVARRVTTYNECD